MYFLSSFDWINRCSLWHASKLQFGLFLSVLWLFSSSHNETRFEMMFSRNIDLIFYCIKTDLAIMHFATQRVNCKHILIVTVSLWNFHILFE